MRVLVLAGVLIAAAARLHGQTNHLPNGDFDTGIRGWSSDLTGKGEIRWRPGDARGKPNSGHVALTAKNKDVPYPRLLSPCMRFPLAPEDQTPVVYMKARAEPDSAVLGSAFMHIFDSSDCSGAAAPERRVGSASGGYGWRQSSYPYLGTLTVGSARISLTCLPQAVGQTGTCSFDDIFIGPTAEIAGPATAALDEALTYTIAARLDQSVDDPLVLTTPWTWSLDGGETIRETDNSITARWRTGGTKRLTAKRRYLDARHTVTIGHPAASIDVLAMEVTQGIQNWQQDVPLIAGKRTFIRAHLRSQSQTSTITGELIGKRDSVDLPGSPLRITNYRVSVLTASASGTDRTRLSNSMNFELPTSWTSGTVELILQSPNAQLTCSTPQGSCMQHVIFKDMPTLQLNLVPITWRDANGNDHTPTTDHLQRVTDEFKNTLPIGSISTSRYAAIRTVREPDGLFDFLAIVTQLRLMRALEGFPETYYVGVLSDVPSATSFTSGMAPIDGYVLAGYDVPRNLTHEFGHAAGRRHTRCTNACSNGTEAGLDTSYPYPDGRISPTTTGPTAFFGFDWTLNDVPAPTHGDVMSYCCTTWMSDVTYNAIRDHLDRNALQATRTRANATNGDIFFVAGTRTRENGTRIDAIAASTGMPDEGTIGAYWIDVQDASGSSIARVPLTLAPASEDEESGSFLASVPRDQRVRRLALVHDGIVLDHRTASPNAPSLTIERIETPQRGESTLRWAVSDADGDALLSTVEYSPDGSKWLALAANLHDPELNVKWSAVPPSTMAQVRVSVTDGLHVTAATSEPFSVLASPPTVQITSPAPNDSYADDATILMSAYTHASNVTWLSDRNGTLGTGPELVVLARSLAAGAHSITAAADDGPDLRTAVAVQIWIGARPPRRRAARH